MNRLPRSCSLHTDAAGFAPPDAFGPFRVLHQVGAGTLGPVFRAYDADRDRLVAVKVFRLDLVPDRMHHLVARLERLTAAPLTHPAIAAPIATGTDGILIYLVQDFVAAESLDVVLRDHGPLAPADALRVTSQLAGALDFAAAAGVCHGALHPRDVLLSQGDTRVTGLGVARAIEEIGVAPPVRRPYSAPERVAGAAWDRRADVFSVAALAYEMLTGKRVSGVGAEAAAALPEIDGADMDVLRGAFAGGLAPNPDDRFQIALDFASAIQTALPDIATPAQNRLGTVPAFAEPEPRLPLEDDMPPVTAQPSIDDLDLRAAEAARYDEIEVAPAIVSTDDVSDIRARLYAPDAGVAPITPALPGLLRSDGLESTEERTRISLVTLAAPLMIGVAIGFGVGYAVGGRQAAPAPSPVAVATPTKPPTPAAGKEYTESPVKGVRPDTPAPAAPSAETATQARLPASPKLLPNRPGRGSGKPDTPTAGPGRLLVRSTPAGARVIVDGEDRGITPAAIRGLARGAHRVRVERDGYVAGDRRVVITAARPAQSFTVAMERASSARAANTREPSTSPALGSGVGALAVESRPPGASVFLDGRLVGKTPLAVARLGTGEHAVRLERDGYRPWSSITQISNGQRTRVTASLER